MCVGEYDMGFFNFFGTKSSKQSETIEPVQKMVSVVGESGRQNFSFTKSNTNLPEFFVLQTSANYINAFLYKNSVVGVLPMVQKTYECTPKEPIHNAFTFLQNYSPLQGEYPIQQAWVQLSEYPLTVETTKYFVTADVQIDIKFTIHVLCKPILQPHEIIRLLNAVLECENAEQLSDNRNGILNILEKILLPKFMQITLEKLQEQVRMTPAIIDQQNLQNTELKNFLISNLTAQFAQIGTQIHCTHYMVEEGFSRRIMQVVSNRKAALEERQQLEQALLVEAQQREKFSTTIRNADNIVAFKDLDRELLLLQIKQLQKKQAQAISTGVLTPIQIKRKKWKYRLGKEFDVSQVMPFKDLALNIIMELQDIGGLCYDDVEVCEANSDIWYPAYSNRSEFSIFRQAIEAAAEQFQLTLPTPEEYFEYTNDYDSVFHVRMSELVTIITQSPQELHFIRKDSMGTWQNWKQVPEVVQQVGL